VDTSTALTYTFPVESYMSQKHRADDALARLSTMLSPEDQDDLDLQIRIRVGNIEAEIRSAVRDELAGLVVMGTHQHRLIRTLLVGSVTEGMVRKLSVPVLTVSSDAQPRTLSTILFATDLSESSHDGFKFALDLAGIAGAHLIVLHAIEPVPMSFGGALPAIANQDERKLLIENARRKLAELQSEGMRQNVVVAAEITEGIAAEKILETAEKSASMLIVLTIHGKGLVERALLGSTAEHIVRNSKVPVLSFPVHLAPARVEPTEHHHASIPDLSAMP
ncbi:MAG TPA: universal stress protein, partial [Terriglobia bacterium]|nr:universal stress protein [Terriglobia bacterium]